MVEFLSNYRAKLLYLKVAWKPLYGGRITCNTDGANNGNPSLSAYGFFLRGSDGNLLYAKAQGKGIASNLEAEVMAINMALTYCVDKNISEVQFQSDFLGLNI